MISRTVQAIPKLRSDLQALSKASPIAEVAVSSNATFWIGILLIGTSRKRKRRGAEARKRLSVTEARSCFGDEIILVSRKDGSCSKLLTFHLWHSIFRSWISV